MLLEVEAGAVGVGADEADAFGKRLAASAGHEDGLAVQCLPALAGAEAFRVSGVFQTGDHAVHGFAFGFAVGNEADVVVGQRRHGPAVFGRAIDFPAGFGTGCKFVHDNLDRKME